MSASESIQQHTLDEFNAFINRPENVNRSFEFICGEIAEVVSRQRSSAIAAEILILIGPFAKQTKRGFFTVADGGYAVGNERYMPDIAFVSYDRQKAPTDERYAPHLDLAIEVLAPANIERHMRMKVYHYSLNNVVTWVVNAERETVDVYVPGQAARTYTNDMTMPGDPVLPGLQIKVADFFDVSEVATRTA